MKNLKFSYDLSNLSTWTEENADAMLLKSVLGQVLPRYSTIRPNIQGDSVKLGFLETNPVLQDETCSFGPTTGDTTTVNQFTINMCHKKVNQSLCPYELRDYYLSQRLTGANFIESVPFEEVIVQDMSNRIAEQLEYQFWNNAIATGTTYGGACFDGVLTQIVSGNGATELTYTAMTSSNGLEVASTYYESLPDAVVHRNDIVLYVSYSDYRGLVASMRNSSYINLFSFDDANAGQGQEWSVMIPGTNVMVIPTVGLTGANKAILGPASYIHIGLNSTENGGIDLRGMYNPYEDKVQFMGHISYGLGIFDIAKFVVAS